MKLICFINGVSFAGKTRLANILTHELMEKLPDYKIHNISFELLYNTITSDYSMNFSRAIWSKIKDCQDTIILAESVQFFNKEKYKDIENNCKQMYILCHPDIDSHEKNCSNYKDIFGWYDIRRRLGPDSILNLRRRWVRINKYPNRIKPIIYRTDDDISNILERILSYVTDR